MQFSVSNAIFVICSDQIHVRNKNIYIRVATNSDFDRISNTEYYSFLGIYEYRIPNNIRSWKLTNTEYRILFGQGKFTNTEYRIVLFGLNYSNTELFEHWNGPAYSNFRKECVNLAQMIKVIVNNVSAFKIINIFSHFLSQNVTLQGFFQKKIFVLFGPNYSRIPNNIRS